MALLFVDGFNHYATAEVTQKWTAVGAGDQTVDAGEGRNGSPGWRNNTSNAEIYISVDNSNDWVMAGVAAKFNNVQSNETIVIADTENEYLVFMRALGNGAFDVWRGPNTTQGTRILGPTRANVWHQNNWIYLELRVRFHDTVGEVYVYANGRLEGSATGIDTVPSSIGAYTPTLPWSIVQYRINGSMDDAYVANGVAGEVDASSGNLGDVQVETLFVNAAGASSQWTPLTGNNEDMVDEASVDGDTTYNFANVMGNEDIFNFDDISLLVAGTIYGVVHSAALRKEGVGNRDIRLITRSGGANTYGPIEAIGQDSYVYYREPEETDPNTSVAWTIAGLNAAQFGVEINN